MVLNISLVGVSLATVGVESVLYGIFFLLSIMSMYLLISRQTHGQTRRTKLSMVFSPLVLANIAIWMTVTAHWVCTLIRLFQAIIYYNDGTMPLRFYADLTQTSQVVKTGFLVASVLIGDAMIIYRLWVVWNYNRPIIVFPVLSLLALLACGTGITYQFSQYKPGLDVFRTEAGRWITSNAVFSLVTNMYSSTLIAWRVWNINSTTEGYGAPKLNSVLAIVIESAALYTSWSIVFLVTYRVRSNLQFLTIDTVAVMSGLAFMLINVRVGLGWAQKANTLRRTTESNSKFSSLFKANGNTMEQSNVKSKVHDEYDLHPLAINMSTHTTRFVDTQTSNTLHDSESQMEKSTSSSSV